MSDSDDELVARARYACKRAVLRQLEAAAPGSVMASRVRKRIWSSWRLEFEHVLAELVATGEVVAETGRCRRVRLNTVVHGLRWCHRCRIRPPVDGKRLCLGCQLSAGHPPTGLQRNGKHEERRTT